MTGVGYSACRDARDCPSCCSSARSTRSIRSTWDRVRDRERRFVPRLVERDHAPSTICGTVRVFEFFTTRGDARPVKVGQCAVAIARPRRPVPRSHPPHCLPIHSRPVGRLASARSLPAAAPASYAYGSTWNHECTLCGTSRHGGLPGGCLIDGGAPSRLHRLRGVAGLRRPTGAPSARTSGATTRRRPRRRRSVTTRRGVAACRDVPGAGRAPPSGDGAGTASPSRACSTLPMHALKLMCLGDDAFISLVEAKGRRAGRLLRRPLRERRSTT